MAIVWFVVGLVCLVVGADALVRGASRLAGSLGIPPLIIGLTVVAFGTSAPELAVSVKSALSNQAGIALGNVIGSNIFNVLFILGLSAVIVPLVVSKQLIRLDVPLMVGVSVLAYVLALDGKLDFINGVILLAVLVSYIAFLIYEGRKEPAESESASEEVAAGSNGLVNLMWIVVGLGLLILGSRWLVDSAVTFARHLGVSELVVGLTIVAAGTSLPEVVTSIIAALRGERDIAVGNVVGSNIFNILCVLGVTSVVAPEGIEVSSAVLGFDLPVMVVVALACVPIFFTNGTISRWEGVLLLAYYVAYTLYLVLAASHHDALPVFSAVLMYFAAPLTLVTLYLIALLEIRAHRKAVKAL